jgi:glucose-6-phosphate-specific signal transduction histidine kinase
VVFLLPVVAVLKHLGWSGALLTGLFASLPMNTPHIIPNPYMPADVRMIHFIETASSTFLFGVLVFWLFALTYPFKK